MASREQSRKQQAPVSPAAERNTNVATEEDVYAKQERLFTGGTSEMPS